MSTLSVPQTDPVHPSTMTPITLGSSIAPAPQAGPEEAGQGAGLREHHLTPPAQHCLLWPLWECCAICWPQTFYEREDRKKFSSIDPESGLLPPPPLNVPPWP